ncbi:MAG: glycosyltransferase [Chitinophagaceae bacterium]|nr:glycosyltransferase [Chitinophagaceae bacterium]
MITHGISVIIPNFNGRLLLPQIIPPLLIALKNISTAYEIIVADDCSTDDSVQYLRQHYKEIIVLQDQINKGFAPTMNKGIYTSKYKYLLFLNSDVKLSPDYFVLLLKYFDNPDTFGVMGRIIGWDDDNIQDGGKYPYFHGVKIKTSGNYVPMHPSREEKFYSMYLSGANALVSREKVIQLNGFDEIFAPYYVEDYELSLRAWRLGWKCYYEHFAVCRHRTSTSIKTKNKKKYIEIIYNRNKMYLHAIHLSGGTKVLWYLQLMGEMLIRIFTFRFHYLKAVFLFLRNAKEVAASRNKFSALFQNIHDIKSVKEVVKIIRSSLEKVQIMKF